MSCCFTLSRCRELKLPPPRSWPSDCLGFALQLRLRRLYNILAFNPVSWSVVPPHVGSRDVKGVMFGRSVPERKVSEFGAVVCASGRQVCASAVKHTSVLSPAWLFGFRVRPRAVVGSGCTPAAPDTASSTTTHDRPCLHGLQNECPQDHVREEQECIV